MRAQHRADAAALNLARIAGQLHGKARGGLVGEEAVDDDLALHALAEGAQPSRLLHAAARQRDGDDGPVLEFQNGLDVQHRGDGHAHIAQAPAAAQGGHIVHGKAHAHALAQFLEFLGDRGELRTLADALSRLADEQIEAGTGGERIDHLDVAAAQFLGGQYGVGVGAAQARGDGDAEHFIAGAAQALEGVEKARKRRLRGVHMVDALGHLALGVFVVFDAALVETHVLPEGITHGHDDHAQFHCLLMGQIGCAVGHDGDHASPPPMPRNLR